MQGEQSFIKFQNFRKSTSWEKMATEVCAWVNSNINVIRIISIASVQCHYNNEAMVNLYYDDSKIPEDILHQTSNTVLTYQIFSHPKTASSTWRTHNEQTLPSINDVAKRGTIIAINKLEDMQNKQHQNRTIVWYKRSK